MVYFYVLHVRVKRFQLAHVKTEGGAIHLEKNIKSLINIINRKSSANDPFTASMRDIPATQAEYNAINQYISQKKPNGLQPNNDLNF